jgi:nitrite reductase/ring-hydroxylating ferredoxin subunit
MGSLCSVLDIPDGGSKGFVSKTSDSRFLYIVVRQKNKIFVYKNACPHRGLPLDFQPGQFLTTDGTLIQCSNHGAKFHIDDGLCISGPCKGEQLVPVRTEIRSGNIFLIESN